MNNEQEALQILRGFLFATDLPIGRQVSIINTDFFHLVFNSCKSVKSVATLHVFRKI